MALTGKFVMAKNLRAEIYSVQTVSPPGPPEVMVEIVASCQQTFSVEEWREFIERVSRAIGEEK